MAVNASQNPLPNDKILDWSKLKGFADNTLILARMARFCLIPDRKHCGEKAKMLVSTIYAFSHNSFKGGFPQCRSIMGLFYKRDT